LKLVLSGTGHSKNPLPGHKHANMMVTGRRRGASLGWPRMAGTMKYQTSLVPFLSLITVAFSSFNVGWVRKWTLFGGFSTGTFTSTVLRLTVSFDSFRNVARSSKMAAGSLLETTLRSGFAAGSSAMGVLL